MRGDNEVQIFMPLCLFDFELTLTYFLRTQS